MWSAVRLAQEVGAGLGKREVLLTTLSKRRGGVPLEAAVRPAMSALRIILGDQLSSGVSALAGLDPERDIVLMMEVMEENTYVPHHKQKIVLVLSAMRHFAATLRETGVSVDYVFLDDPDNTGDLTTEVQRAVARHAPDTACPRNTGRPVRRLKP